MRWAPLLLALAACQRAVPIDEVRSDGMPVAILPAAVQARVFDAAVRAAFDVDPGLVLLLNPTHLPAGSGYEGGSPVPDSLRAALQAAGVISGVCEPKRSGEQRAPLCDAGRSGYVVRGSELFQAGGDTVHLYLASEVFAAAGGPGQRPFAFEMAYKLVPREEPGWRVVAEGRVRETK